MWSPIRVCQILWRSIPTLPAESTYLALWNCWGLQIRFVIIASEGNFRWNTGMYLLRLHVFMFSLFSLQSHTHPIPKALLNYARFQIVEAVLKRACELEHGFENLKPGIIEPSFRDGIRMALKRKRRKHKDMKKKQGHCSILSKIAFKYKNSKSELQAPAIPARQMYRFYWKFGSDRQRIRRPCIGVQIQDQETRFYKNKLKNEII